MATIQLHVTKEEEIMELQYPYIQKSRNENILDRHYAFIQITVQNRDEN